MTSLRKINNSFISILSDPFSQEAWADFDLSCVYLNKEGFTFKQIERKLKCAYKTTRFPKEQQINFIDIELTKAVELQLFEWSKLLLEYKKNVLSKWWKIKHQKIKVYQSNYFKEVQGVINFKLSGNPLLDLKFHRILSRRTRLESN